MPDVAALQLLVPGARPLLDAVTDLGLPGVSLLPPPHVSLGYPWRAAAEADPALARAAAAAATPFEVRFEELSCFPPDGRGRVLLHVVPLDPGPFRALAAATGADLRSVHLSVARVAGRAVPGDDLTARLAVLRAAVAPLLPLRCRVDVLQLSVQADGAWQPPLDLALGAA